MANITNQIWPLVIVGRGSSAAFYVATAKDLLASAAILAIGDGDAWSAAVRGYAGNSDDPTKFINHPLYLIAHFQKFLPEFKNDKVDRLAWAEMNHDVLKECGVTLHDAKVKTVSEVEDMPFNLKSEDQMTRVSGYKIELEGNNNNNEVYAYKVVMAAGAGGHRVPPEAEAARTKNPNRILDLDEFAKLNEVQLKNKTVFVFGPNAAIDAVQKAIHYNCTIIWLIKGSAQPPILATQPAVTAALKNKPSIIHRYNSFRILPSIARDTVFVDVDGVLKKGDYFVYGMGQTGKPFEAIDTNIKAKLTPIYDKNDYLGAGPSTILGYEAEGTGLRNGFEVVGAMSAQAGRWLRDWKSNIKNQIASVRSIKGIHDSIQSAGFPVAKPFLLKDPDFLASQPRQPLAKQLKQEAAFVANKYPTNRNLAEGLESLVALLLNYHTANSNPHLNNNLSLKDYQTLLNQQTHNMPKGAVADAGQLTSLGAAMAAKHAHVPKHVGTQSYTPKSQEQINKDKLLPRNQQQWVDVKQELGGANFSKDNQTVLQIYLCMKYPNIPDDELNNWVARHMQNLHNSGVGFVNNSQFDAELKRMNQRNLDPLKNL